MPAGRRPKPTALRQLEGSRIRRKGNEPQPGGTPKCPGHLDAEAKKEWRRISQELVGIGLLTSVDRAALAAYCAAWSRWIAAETHVQKHGTVWKSPKSGFPIQNPQVGIGNVALDKMHKFLIEFGMTPASRSRLSIEPGTKSADPFAEFMQGLGAGDIGDDIGTEDITSSNTASAEVPETAELCEPGD